jgi:superoxide oxidase
MAVDLQNRSSQEQQARSLSQSAKLHNFMILNAYNPTARSLHWISAAVILWALFSGFAASLMAEDSALRAAVALFNAVLTAAFTPLFILRMLHARRHTMTPLANLPGWHNAAALVVHRLLYACTSVVLVSGFILVSGTGHQPDATHGKVWQSLSIAQEYAHVSHRYACIVLLALLLLHIGAVAHHHWCGRPILRRMLPRRSQPPINK